MQGARKAVLIVEDNQTMAECLRELLQRQEGIVVFEASTLEEADAVMGQVAFDEVLLDARVQGPLERTVSFLQRVKNHGFPGRVTAISAQRENNEVLCQNGADAAFVKTDVSGILGCVLSMA